MNSEKAEPDLGQIGAPEILDALADGAYITDCNRKIVFWSRSAERITGWPANEVVGHACADNILVHVDKDGHQLCGEEYCPLHRAMVTGENSSEPVLVFAQHKQGYRIPVEVSVSPLRDQSGRTVGGVEVFRDFSSVLQDLRQAKAIQDGVLASNLPNDDRVRFEVVYSPEEIVGGDFYRVEALDEVRYAVMVADVMGHGLAAALYTMQLRSIWEECRDYAGSPSRFLEELNQRLFRLSSPEGYFATAVCACLNADSGQFWYARASHPSPLLIRRTGGIESLSISSPALGLLEHATYAEAQALLEPGDGLLLITDGATEITSPQGEELRESGLARLLTELGPEKLDLRRIEQKLLQHTNQIRLPDDLTLLSIFRCTKAEAD